MSYLVEFLEDAKKEWDKLDHTVQNQFAKKLFERKENPTVLKDKLCGMKDCYKIKLRSVGYRLVYRIYEQKIVIEVIAIGKRDKEGVYRIASVRADQ
jgi:mRNA interferase RelE/StbE